MKTQLLVSSLFIGLSIAVNAQFDQFWKVSEVQRMSDSVNQLITDESCPVFSSDMSKMYFVRTYDLHATGGEYDQEIWSTSMNESGNYTSGSPIAELNNKYNNALLGVNADESRVYLLDSYSKGKRKKKKDVIGIAFSTRNDSVWGVPSRMDIPDLNIEGDCYGFYITEDENILIISYAGPESLGQEDLYVCTKTNGNWTPPVHMGDVINSEGYEITPFLNRTQDTLYFSSDGMGGEGDADIFFSVKQGVWTNWTEPVNLGSEINSPKFDAYFSITDSLDRCYWSSNREADRSDIYYVDVLIPPLLTARLEVKEISEFGARDGGIDLVTEGGVEPFEYQWSNGYVSEDLGDLDKGTYSVVVKDAIGQKVNLEVRIEEPAPVVNKVIELPEVRYATGKWELLVDHTINSKDSLNFVYKLMTEYPNMVLELNSHADSRGSSTTNRRLSQKRAQTCVDYLVEEKGIKRERLVAKGRGEDSPRTWYDPVTGQKVVLTEAYINKFKRTDKSKFEMLHQLNRRTEVRVVRM